MLYSKYVLQGESYKKLIANQTCSLQFIKTRLTITFEIAMRLLLIFILFVVSTCIAGYEVDPEIAQNIAEGEALLREVEQFLDDPSVPQSLKVRKKCIRTEYRIS